MRKNLLLLALLAVGSMADQHYSLFSRPMMVKQDTKPASGLLETITVKSHSHCVFSCTQNVECWHFSINGNECNLYEPTYPAPDPEFVEAEGYTLYKARNKIFKLIPASYPNYTASNDVCKEKFGNRLACPTEPESMKLLEYMQASYVDLNRCDINGALIGLRSKGRAGIFQWETGEIIDVVKKTGFQLWEQGWEPKLYKVEDVSVQLRVCPHPGYWMENPVNIERWVYCEMP